VPARHQQPSKGSWPACRSLKSSEGASWRCLVQKRGQRNAPGARGRHGCTPKLYPLPRREGQDRVAGPERSAVGFRTAGGATMPRTEFVGVRLPSQAGLGLCCPLFPCTQSLAISPVTRQRLARVSRRRLDRPRLERGATPLAQRSPQTNRPGRGGVQCGLFVSEAPWQGFTARSPRRPGFHSGPWCWCWCWDRARLPSRPPGTGVLIFAGRERKGLPPLSRSVTVARLCASWPYGAQYYLYHRWACRSPRGELGRRAFLFCCPPCRHAAHKPGVRPAVLAWSLGLLASCVEAGGAVAGNGVQVRQLPRGQRWWNASRFSISSACVCPPPVGVSGTEISNSAPPVEACRPGRFPCRTCESKAS